MTRPSKIVHNPDAVDRDFGRALRQFADRPEGERTARWNHASTCRRLHMMS